MSSSLVDRKTGGDVRTLAWMATRILRGSQGKGMVAFLGRVSIIGLAVSVAVLTVVLAVMNGFEREFRERILGVAPHAVLQLRTPLGTSEWMATKKRFEERAGIRAADPMVGGTALLRAGNTVAPVQYQGLTKALASSEALLALVDSGSRKTTGAKQGLAQAGLVDDRIWIGQGIAAAAGVAVGDRVQLFASAELPDRYSAKPPRNLLSRARQRVFQVAGILRTGTELDQSLVMITLASAGELSALEDQLPAIQLRVADIFSAHRTVHRAAMDLGYPGRVMDWRTRFGNLYTAIQLSRQLVVLLIASIIAIAVFNVVVTLGMVVKNNPRDIAVLRVLGLNRRRIVQLFMLQGARIAACGTFVGLLAGTVLALLLPGLVASLENLAGITLLDTEIYPIDYLPSQLRWQDFILLGSTAVVMSLLATLVPAWRAARIRPATALRDH